MVVFNSSCEKSTDPLTRSSDGIRKWGKIHASRFAAPKLVVVPFVTMTTAPSLT